MLKSIRDFINKIKEINRRYATPRIKMTKWTKFALFMLRVYLVFLIAILLYKFITLL